MLQHRVRVDNVYYIWCSWNVSHYRRLNKFSVSLCTVNSFYQIRKNCSCLTIYGIEVDTVSNECRLTLDKVETIRNKRQELQDEPKSSLREIQSLIGLLNFACSVVVPGRAFLSRLIKNHGKKTLHSI